MSFLLKTNAGVIFCHKKQRFSQNCHLLPTCKLCLPFLAKISKNHNSGHRDVGMYLHMFFAKHASFLQLRRSVFRQNFGIL
jgi:hypothetical protein